MRCDVSLVARRIRCPDLEEPCLCFHLKLENSRPCKAVDTNQTLFGRIFSFFCPSKWRSKDLLGISIGKHDRIGQLWKGYFGQV